MLRHVIVVRARVWRLRIISENIALSSGSTALTGDLAIQPPLMFGMAVGKTFRVNIAMIHSDDVHVGLVATATIPIEFK